MITAVMAKLITMDFSIKEGFLWLQDNPSESTSKEAKMLMIMLYLNLKLQAGRNITMRQSTAMRS